LISVVTGTLNRRSYLDGLIYNTIAANPQIELVLVDGGSTDGSLEYLRSIAHPRLKVIEFGQRSPYPHYMNLGIQHASNELICQWNDDVLLYNNWSFVIDKIDEEHDAYLFNWKTGKKKDMNQSEWLKCDGMRDNGWIIINNAEYDYPESRGEKRQEICMNYGIYKKDVFRKYGLYNTAYQYYCADSEMAMRAYHSGAKFKTCFDVKVCVLPAEKRAIMLQEDIKKHHIDCHCYVTDPSSIKPRFDYNCGEYLK